MGMLDHLDSSTDGIAGTGINESTRFLTLICASACCGLKGTTGCAVLVVAPPMLPIDDEVGFEYDEAE